jgi:hypothetical protein
MSRLAVGCWALAAIIAMARRDLNAADFISRGVEGNGERPNKSIGCRYHGMGRRA